MNDYAIWRGGQDSEASSIFDQIHSGPPRDEEDGTSAPLVARMYVDPRLNPDPLTHLAQAVHNIDIRNGMGREPPPHQSQYPLPPIRHFPYPTPTYFSNPQHQQFPQPPPPNFHHPFQPPPSNFQPFPQAPPQFLPQAPPFPQAPPQFIPQASPQYLHPHYPQQPPPHTQTSHRAPPPTTQYPAQSTHPEHTMGQISPRLPTHFLLEPKIRDSLRYAGEPKLLRQFLLDIYDAIDRHSDHFQNDKRRINWVAAHFGSTAPTKSQTSSQSWFLALLERNTLLVGVTDPYANLKGLEYVEPSLTSFSAFIAELINVFGDRMSAKSAREALEDCVPGDTTVVDYNARFTSLSHQVSQSAEDAMLRYANGLNRDIYLECARISGWISAPTLAIKQLLTIEATKVVEALNSAPSGKKPKAQAYAHPHSHSHQPLPKPTPVPVIL